MIQIQISISITLDDKNTIEIDVLEREDANDHERALADQIYELHRAVLTEIRDQLPAGEVTITEITSDQKGVAQ